MVQSANVHLTGGALTLGPSWNAASHDLQLTFSSGVTVPSVFANVANFTSDGAGGTTFSGNFTTLGNQTYNNAVVQSANVHLTGGALTLGPSWNAASHDLQLTFSSGVTVPSVFANVANFTSDGAGGTTFSGNFTTLGNQTYNNAVVQSANVHLTGGALTLGPSWNAASHDLQLTFSSGVTVPSVFANVANFTSDGAGGTTFSGNFTTSGNQTYNNAVVQSANVHLTGGALTLGPSWNAASHDLQLTFSSGVTVPSVFANVANFTSDGAGGTTFSGNFTTSGNQTYNNAVVQSANVHLTGGALTLGPSWNAASHDLQLTFSSGVTVPSVFANVANFTSDGAGGTTFSGNFTTSGNQTYNNAVTLAGSGATLTGANLSLADTITGAGRSLTVNSVGTTTFGSAVSGVNVLTTDAAGNTVVNGKINASSVALNDAVALNAAGTVGSPSIQTANGQTFGGPVTLGADTVLTDTGGNDINFNSTVNGTTSGGQSLTVNEGVNLGGAVGGLVPLANFIVNSSGSLALNQNITASSVAVHSGTDGSGDLTFGPGVTVRADTQSYRAGDGPGGGTAAQADLTGNGTIFQNTAGSGAPNSFTYRQDASIASGNIPVISPASYVIESDDGTVQLPGLALSGTLQVTANGDITQNGAITVGDTATFTAGSGNDITLGLGNNFNNIIITSGRSVTLYDVNGITFGPQGSAISGDLSVTTGDTGTIDFSGSPITTVGGNLTVNAGGDLNGTYSVAGAVSITVGGQNNGSLSSSLSGLSAVEIPVPRLETTTFSTASISVDEAAKILPPGSIGTLWLQIPFPPTEEKNYRIEGASKWTSGPIAAMGSTGGPQVAK